MKRLILFLCICFFLSISLKPTLFAAGPLEIIDLSKIDESAIAPPSNLPVIVKVGFYLLKVDSIDENTETFTADIYLRLKWNDPRLAFSGQGTPQIYTEELCRLKLLEIWSPDLEFVNNTALPEITNNSLSIDPSGDAELDLGISAKYRSELDYRKFPFDTQQLKIIISSFTWDENVVVFEILPDEIDFERREVQVEELKIQKLEVETFLDVKHEGEKNKYSDFVATIFVKRSPSFYNYQIFIPLIVVLAISFCLFFIPPQEFANRIIITLTCILIFIATKFTINQELPKIDYLTIADKFFYLSYLFSGITAGICLIEYILWKKNHRKASKIDKLARVLVPTLCLLSYIFLLLLELS